jgi:predicted Rossmann-fold nucleotide-binding protein
VKRQAKIIAIFGSSRPREGDSHYAQAHAPKAALAEKGFVVCSGGVEAH